MKNSKGVSMAKHCLPGIDKELRGRVKRLGFTINKPDNGPPLLSGGGGFSGVIKEKSA
jgi:hypothetical protein